MDDAEQLQQEYQKKAQTRIDEMNRHSEKVDAERLRATAHLEALRQYQGATEKLFQDIEDLSEQLKRR